MEIKVRKTGTCHRLNITNFEALTCWLFDENVDSFDSLHQVLSPIRHSGDYLNQCDSVGTY